MDREPLITILTINYNTSDFIELMLDAFSQLTKNLYKVIVCDNGSTDKHLLYLAKLCKKHSNVECIFRQQSQAGSVGHGEALDLLISKVRTPYFVTMDADALLLYPSWDEVLLSKMTDQCKIVGTPPVKGGTKDVSFPLVYTVLYDTKAFKSLDCYFLPVEENMTSGKDTGYIIQEKYTTAGYTSVVFEDRNTRVDQSGPYGDILCAEYYLKEDLENIFCCHFARGSSDGVAKYKNKVIYKIPLFGKIVKKLLGVKDRKKWIKRSYDLLNLKKK